MTTHRYDVIVIGGGHAGIEAAGAAARMGAKTALLTLDPTKVASMPCNPSVGGLGKGHIVYEVSAFGGLMPKLCSQTYLQARMLNTSKGPAVQGLRLQIDKYAYSIAAHQMLVDYPNLTMVPDMGVQLLVEQTAAGKRVVGVLTQKGLKLYAPAVVVTCGTFLNGVVHVGRTRYKAGRRGEAAVVGLSESISAHAGMPIGRLKTGTPPRLLGSSLDYAAFEQQEKQELSYLFEFNPLSVAEKIPCFITHTNDETHRIIAKNLHLSAMYSGNIKGVGPRYCPSIEDKVGRYPDRPSHHVFIEPEGQGIDEIYPAGLSTSLPLAVQYQYIRSIKGFEKAIIAKCGYAIEYDFFQPTNLTHALEVKTLPGLFLAGQINGTTGYEEAAGQGVIAGINAALCAAGKERFVVKRSESYIGVMIDDLITLGADEPYRMFTARAERRLLLRQDNVFTRLMPHAQRLGLITDSLYAACRQEMDVVQWATELATAPAHKVLRQILLSVEFTSEVQAQVRAYLEPLASCAGINLDLFSPRALLSLHAQVRYEGYLVKELAEVDKLERFAALSIPPDFDYSAVPGLSKELVSKLKQYCPGTIAQAQLIQGMTPAALSVLIFNIRRSALKEERDV